MKSRIIKSTGIIAVSTLASRILGLVRDILIAHFFETKATLDGFWIAFRIPNLFRRLVGEGALTISFIPVYTDYLIQKGEKEALKLAQIVFNVLCLFLGILVVSGVIFSPYIVKIYATGFQDPQLILLTVFLNRLLFPYLFFVCLVAFSMGYLNSHRYFFAPAFSPVLLNVGFIVGAIFLRPFFSHPLHGLAVGVLIGGVMQLLLQVPFLIRAGFKVKISFNINHPGLRKIFKMLGPAVFSLAVYQINILINTNLASWLPGGSVTYLYYADRLTEIVLGIFVISIANVMLPEISQCNTEMNHEKLRRVYVDSVSAALFLAIPAAVALIVIGYEIISVLLIHGKFTTYNAEMTYKALFFSSMGVASVAILRITVPAFYSLKNTRIPLVTAIIAVVCNALLGFFLMQTSLRHAGLALANAIAMSIQMVLIVFFFIRKIGGIDIHRVKDTVGKSCIAAAIMGVALYLVRNGLNWAHASLFQRIIYVVCMVLGGGGIYFFTSYLIGVKEILHVRNMLFSKKSGTR